MFFVMDMIYVREGCWTKTINQSLKRQHVACIYHFLFPSQKLTFHILYHIISFSAFLLFLYSLSSDLEVIFRCQSNSFFFFFLRISKTYKVFKGIIEAFVLLLQLPLFSKKTKTTLLLLNCSCSILFTLRLYF